MIGTVTAARPVGSRASVLAACLLGGCMPVAATEQGGATERLYSVFLAGGIVIGLLVWSLATFAILRYRRPGPHDPGHPLPRQTAGNLTIEIVWTAIPVAIVLALFGLSVVALGAIERRDPDPGVELRATAYRWGWTFDYPGRSITVSSAPAGADATAATPGTVGGPEVVVPVGVPIHVTLDAVDVNHAFFVPRFLFKRDAIPGRPTTFDLVVSAPGIYGGVCAEFCGVYHAEMPFTIRAVTAAEFERWAVESHQP